MFARTPLPLEDAKAAVGTNATGAGPHVDLALALLRERRLDEASKELDAAFKIDPNDKDAHFLAAKLAGAHKDMAARETHILAIKNGGGDGYTVETALAELAELRKRQDGTARRARGGAPLRPDADRGAARPVRDCGRRAPRRRRPDLPARARARSTSTIARPGRCCSTRLVEAKRWDEARKDGESALYVDVEDFGIHLRLRRGPGRDGRPRARRLRARERAAVRRQARGEDRGAAALGRGTEAHQAEAVATERRPRARPLCAAPPRPPTAR